MVAPMRGSDQLTLLLSWSEAVTRPATTGVKLRKFLDFRSLLLFCSILSFERYMLFLQLYVVADVSDQLSEHDDPLGLGQVQAELLTLVHIPPIFSFATIKTHI